MYIHTAVFFAVILYLVMWCVECIVDVCCHHTCTLAAIVVVVTFSPCLLLTSDNCVVVSKQLIKHTGISHSRLCGLTLMFVDASVDN